MQFRCPLRLCYSARAIMGSLLFFAFSWWGILVRIVAIIHFIRRRPDTYWLWIILIHWMGAVVYIAVEVLPDAGLLRQSFKVFPRRKRIRELEAAILAFLNHPQGPAEPSISTKSAPMAFLIRSI